MAIQLSGSLEMLGNIIASGGFTGSFSGSATSASFASTLQGLGSASFAPAGTFNTVSQSFATTSGSLSTRVTNLESTSSTVSSSFATTSGSISSRVTLIEGQYATTGSNNFTGPQYVSQASNAISFTSTASLYTDGGLRVSKDSFVSGTAYFNNVVVYGTSSIQYITSSQVNFGTNIITVNTDTPAVRFGGLAVFDSGSTQLTGSMLWDSERNHWIYSNPSGSSYNSAMLMNGPRNTGSLGSEQGTTSCALMMGQGGDHITSSAIFSYGNATCFYGNALFVSSSCSVGVGTSSPSYTTTNRTVLAVDGSTSALYALQNTGSAVGYVYGDASSVTLWAEGSRNLTVGVASAGTVSLNTNNTSRLYITSGGSVGIGTISPSYILDISGSAVRVKNSGGSADFLLDRATTSAGATSQYLTNGTLKWYTGLRGLANDNLYVFNNATSTNTLILDSTTNAATFACTLLANGDITAQGGNVYAGYGGPAANRGLYVGNPGFQASFLYNNSTGNLDIAPRSGYNTIFTGGNVGIGTSSPVSKVSICDFSGAALPYIDGTTNSFSFNGYYVGQSNSNNTSGIVGGLVLQNNTYAVGAYSPVVAFMSRSSTGAYSNTYAAIFGITAGVGGDSNWTAGHLTFQTSAAYGPVERMRITKDGQVAIGTTCTSTEANLFLGAQGSTEGGQMVLQKATSFQCATHIDNYSNCFRIMSGTDVGTTTVNMSINHINGAATFNGYVTAFGYQSIKGTITLASGATGTIYNVGTGTGQDGLYYVAARVGGGSQIYFATGIVSAMASAPSQLFLTSLYDGANVTLSVNGSNIRITNDGFATLTWSYSIIFQPVD